MELPGGDLKRNGVSLKVQAQPQTVLLALLERPGETITREELRARLWPDDIYVNFEQNLNRAVNKLREVLGDSAENPRFIQTVPRKGYRFIAPVEKIPVAAELQNAAPTQKGDVTRYSKSENPVGVAATPDDHKKEEPPRTSLRQGRVSIPGSWVAVGVSVAFIFVLAASFASKAGHSSKRDENQRSVSIAILPFRSAGDEDPSLTFLSDALPNEVATGLSRHAFVAVRPLSRSRAYSDQDIEKAAGDLHAEIVIAGEYLKAGGTIQVSLEAVEAAENRVLWRDSIQIPMGDWIAMQDRISSTLWSGLLPALGIPAGPQQDSAAPVNLAAYALYLQSLALPHDGPGNVEAIAMLRKSIGLEKSYAPTWQALGARYHFEYDYAHGGSTAWDEAERAYEQALSLDPELISASASLVMMRTEEGRLPAAYVQAHKFLERRPDSGVAHFAMSYVLRYAGLLKQSARECELARAADPLDTMLRTCSQTFIRLGQYSRAESFIQLDGSSDWAQGMLLQVLIRNSQRGQDISQIRPIPEMAAPLIRACYLHHPKSELLELKRQEEEFPTQDPEGTYHVGIVETFCGFYEDGLKWLLEATSKNYCLAEDLETDPILNRLHTLERFSELRISAEQCRSRFMQHVN